MSSTPVEVRRSGQQSFTATNGRGGRVAIGVDGAPDSFTPGELLLAAIAGCSAVTSENLVTRRLGESAEVTVHADRSKDPADPHRFSEVRVSFDVDLSVLENVDDREKLIGLVRRAIEQQCTVSRSVEQGTPIDVSFLH